MGGAKFGPKGGSPGFEHFFEKFFSVKSDPSDNFWHPKHLVSKIFAQPTPGISLMCLVSVSSRLDIYIFKR